MTQTVGGEGCAPGSGQGLQQLGLLLPSAAFGAPPPNDQQSAAQEIAVPDSVTGTTTDSTLEPDEPGGCAPLRGSVSYQFRAPSRGRMVVRLAASGDLDATVEVFRRTRSQLDFQGC